MKQIETEHIKDFLFKMGWEINLKTDRYTSFLPPKNLNLSSDYELYIPSHSNFPDYSEYIKTFKSIITVIYNVSELNLLGLFEKYSISISKSDLKEKVESIKNTNEFFKIFRSNSNLFHELYVFVTVTVGANLKTEYFIFLKHLNRSYEKGLVTNFNLSDMKLISNKEPHHFGFEDALSQVKPAIFDLLFAVTNKNPNYFSEIEKAKVLTEIPKEQVIVFLLKNKKALEFLKKNTKCKELNHYLTPLSHLSKINEKKIN